VAVHAGTLTAVAASKYPTTPVAGPAEALASAVRKRRPAGGWPAMVPAGAPTAVAAVKELAAPTAGPVVALTLAAAKGGPTGRWGSTTVPTGAPAAATAPTAHSRDAAAAT
jgi:hypothetical protein